MNPGPVNSTPTPVPPVHNETEPGQEDDGLDPEDKLANRFEGQYDTEDVPEVWRELCRFFGHNLEHTNYDQGTLLPGTNFRLRPHQMEAVYLILHQSDRLRQGDEKGHKGAIDAMGTGLGKTSSFSQSWQFSGSSSFRKTRSRTPIQGFTMSHKICSNPASLGSVQLSTRTLQFNARCIPGSLSKAIAEVGNRPSSHHRLHDSLSCGPALPGSKGFPKPTMAIISRCSTRHLSFVRKRKTHMVR